MNIVVPLHRPLVIDSRFFPSHLDKPTRILSARAGELAETFATRLSRLNEEHENGIAQFRAEREAALPSGEYVSGDERTLARKLMDKEVDRRRGAGPTELAGSTTISYSGISDPIADDDLDSGPGSVRSPDGNWYSVRNSERSGSSRDQSFDRVIMPAGEPLDPGSTEG